MTNIDIGDATDGFIKRRLRRFVLGFRVPEAYFYLSLMDIVQRFRSVGKRPKVQMLNDYQDGLPVLLISLWEKTDLRPDIKRLLVTARRQGYYIAGVNSSKVKNVELEKYFDVYIERFNYGRDFGSYKAGFKFLRRKKILKNCPRLVMANDSIFYLSKGKITFLKEMKESIYGALGATENFEIVHHLGSFFISLNNRVLNHRKFSAYWRRYRLTDIRPKVILRGELRLSKVLYKITGNVGFSARYSASLVFQTLVSAKFKESSSFFNLTMTGVTFNWRKAYLAIVGEKWRDLSHISLVPRAKDTPFRLTEISATQVPFLNVEDMVRGIKSRLPALDAKDLRSKLDAIATQTLLEAVTSGSQIHNSANLFVRMGLPIVKLDLLYRGAASYSDLVNLSTLIPKTDADELIPLLLSRPYGDEFLSGWKRAAFNVGLI